MREQVTSAPGIYSPVERQLGDTKTFLADLIRPTMSINSTFSLADYSLTSMSSRLNTHSQTHGVIRHLHIGYYLAIACLLLVVYLFKSDRKEKDVDVPFYKAGIFRWMFDAETLVRDSYKKFHDKVYKIKATEGVQVLIPPKFLGELKSLPEDTLSATEALREAMLTSYTHFSPGDNGDLMSALIRTKLTQNIARLAPQLKGELEYLAETDLPECDEWKPVKVQPFILRTVARMVGFVFVGPNLNRDEQWMDISINYVIHVFLAAVKLQFFPEWMRPVAQYLVTELYRLDSDVVRATAMLQPIIKERVMDMESSDSEETKPDDFVQWLLESLPEEQRTDYVMQVKLQLIVSAASTHTTTNLLSECMFDLAAHPELQDILREEASQVLQVDGGWERRESMARLQKMDSFIKETQRLAGNVTSFIRKVIKPIDLSDGTHLPSGTKLLAPLAGICRDERFFSDPNEFDPLRFYRLRQEQQQQAEKAGMPDTATRFQFTSIGEANMHFGVGKHACPGRFFAGNIIKMVLAYFLLNYDLKLKDGEERPKSMVAMMSKAPNPNGEILIRKRTSALEAKS